MEIVDFILGSVRQMLDLHACDIVEVDPDHYPNYEVRADCFLPSFFINSDYVSMYTVYIYVSLDAHMCC